MRRVLLFLLGALLLVATFSSCRKGSVPKPYGYFRIAIPDTAYEYADLQGYPYTFQLSKNAYIEEYHYDGEQYWFNIQYPSINSTIHCSYKVVDNNLRSLSRDAQEFLYGHSSVATSIPMQEYADYTRRVYGLYYELHGNAATPIQFYMTDSVRHFFRASVYCNTIPNQDSLAPIHDYLRVDTRKIMESMIWR